MGKPSYLFSLALCLVVVGWPGPVPAENRALLIGVGEYELKQLEALPGIARDVTMMKDVVRLAGFEDHQVKVLQNREATLAAMEDAIGTWLVQGVTEADRVLLYISTHGSQIPDVNGDESDNADEVLLAYDTGLEGETLVNVLVDDRFAELIRRIPAKERFILVDACHSGTAVKTLVPLGGQRSKMFRYAGMPGGSGGRFLEATPKLKSAENYAALSACEDHEEARASAGGSLFTRGIHEAVARAADENREINLEQLKDHAAEYIRSAVSDKTRVYTPFLCGNMDLARQNFFITSEVWDRLTRLTDMADGPVEFTVNQTRFRIGDPLRITCRVEQDGFLNILNVNPKDSNATVLFPNRFHPENGVKAGDTVTIPETGDAFEMKASEPRGKSLLVVVHTTEPINGYREGTAASAEPFRILSETEIGTFFEVVPKQRGALRASRIITHIE